MKKMNILISMIEGESLCPISILFEDESFLKKFKRELKSNNDIVKSKNKLLKYINDSF